LPDDELLEYIGRADVCLGVFSGGEKADITIQNKIFESLASKKPMITIGTKALDELLTDGQGVMFCKKADPKDLAEKILDLKRNPEKRNKIANNGYDLFLDKLTPQKVCRDLIKDINGTLNKPESFVSMRILVTGSRGFIGRYLMGHLANHEVTELDKKLEDDIEPYFKNQDLVIHLAAKLSKHSPEEIYRVNVDGTGKVARLSLKYGCKLLNISSISMHDDSPYGRSKALAEKKVEKYVDEGLRAITIRPCGITRRKYLPWLIDVNWYPVESLVRDIAKLINEDPFDYRVIEIKGRGNWGRTFKKKLHRLIKKMRS